MKTLIRLALLFCISSGLFLVSDSSFSQTCTPTNMINTATEKPCDVGYSGLMFKRTIVTCPGGAVTQSPDYDRSQCVLNTGGGAVNPCIANPALCMGKPTVLGCPSGKHWTMQGLPYAHCVTDDPVCGWGQSLTKNSIGEPTGCVANTCPSNQVLQGDGISCACPAGDNWNGSTCVTPVSCPTDNTTYSSCPSGQSGQVETTTTYTVVSGACQASTSVYTGNCATIVCPSDSSSTSSCPAGQTGSITTTTSYSVVNGACQPSTSTSNSCTTTAIVCPSNSSSTSSCPAGQTGSITTTTSYSVVNGSCQASTSTSNSCVSCVNSTTTETQACPVGYTGSQTRNATTNSCTGATSYTAWDTGSCQPAAVPITYTTWDFFTFDSGDPSSCSFQSWLLGWQGSVKVSEQLIASAAGFVDNGTCILY